MINYADSKTVDFIEYRELKKGVDINLYLDMEIITLMDIYQKCIHEMDEILSNLNQLNKKLDDAKKSYIISTKQKVIYDELIISGRKYYERYNFLEEKVDILQMAMEKINQPKSVNNSIN